MTHRKSEFLEDVGRGFKRTEDELLRRGEHVQRERDFILVVLLLQPFDQTRGLEKEEGDGEDEGEEAGDGRGREEIHRRSIWVTVQ